MVISLGRNGLNENEERERERGGRGRESNPCIYKQSTHTNPFDSRALHFVVFIFSLVLSDSPACVCAWCCSSFLLFWLIYFVVAHHSHSIARYIVKAIFNLFDEWSDSKLVLVIKQTS